MRLSIFGGTFDPIHDGHLAVASQAAAELRLDRVWIVPAAHPPHKSGATGAGYEDRVRLAELACAAEERFFVSRIEQGGGRNYSIDTIEKVRATLASSDELYFLIGADAFAEIRSWLRWRDVARAVRFLVVSRPGHRYDVPPEARVERIDSLDLDISSSEIRRSLAAGIRPSGLPDAVWEYISEHRLYGVK
ncbi:MAG: nicotinate-nucleotide adenylyltransferase [Bryobacteraceae bacterium]|jgi:nicotinate-nucleotide adenylyltransferase